MLHFRADLLGEGAGGVLDGIGEAGGFAGRSDGFGDGLEVGEALRRNAGKVGFAAFVGSVFGCGALALW